MFFEAVFEPSQEMNYGDEAKKLAGKRIAVQTGWVIAEGPFKGQECYYIPNSTVGWIPQTDLKEMKQIPLVRWKAILKSHGF